MARTYPKESFQHQAQLTGSRTGLLRQTNLGIWQFSCSLGPQHTGKYLLMSISVCASPIPFSEFPSNF